MRAAGGASWLDRRLAESEADATADPAAGLFNTTNFQTGTDFRFSKLVVFQLCGFLKIALVGYRL